MPDLTFMFRPIPCELEHRVSPTSARASLRASVTSLAQDLHWIGELVKKVTSDATEREQQFETEAREEREAAERQCLTEEALAQEQRLADEAFAREKHAVTRSIK